MWADSVEELASEHGLQGRITECVGQDVIEALRDAVVDVIVANNWRTWLSPEVFGVARHGALNVHDGLLPEYAGFSHRFHPTCGRTHLAGQDTFRSVSQCLLRIPRSARPRAFRTRLARPFRRTPGRITIPHEGGIAVVCGSPRANVPASAIVLDRVRLDGNLELPATEFFGHRAGYIQPKV